MFQSRGLITDALEILFQGNNCITGITFSRSLIQQGQLLHLTNFLGGKFLHILALSSQ